MRAKMKGLFLNLEPVEIIEDLKGQGIDVINGQRITLKRALRRTLLLLLIKVKRTQEKMYRINR